MEKLKEYDAVNDLTEKDYREIFEAYGTHKVNLKVNSKTAFKMFGLFWSEKYQQIMYGKFDKQNVLSKDEFIKRLKKTIQ